ncbi:carboxymuconolactone decarboxylase family protein, partial [Pseudomonas aeruginosa]|nr:carboxymuconolactone decarboxylase family protein [Pseudomonas aeruginosa]
MSRVPVLTLENAPEAALPFLQTALNNSGYIPNLLGVLANAPAALETYLTVSGLNAKASLGLPEREVVQLVAATTHGCDFCVAGHTAVARNKARLPEPVIAVKPSSLLRAALSRLKTSKRASPHTRYMQISKTPEEEGKRPLSRRQVLQVTPVGLFVGRLLSRLGLGAGRLVERHAAPAQGFQAFTGAAFA